MRLGHLRMTRTTKTLSPCHCTVLPFSLATVIIPTEVARNLCPIVWSLATGAFGSPNSLWAIVMARHPAAYSPEGAAWVDNFVHINLDGKCGRFFDAAYVRGHFRYWAIQCVAAEIISTYLAWVDFSGTGWSRVGNSLSAGRKVGRDRQRTIGPTFG